MSTSFFVPLNLFVAACGVLLAGYIVRKILKKKLREEYALFWGVFTLAVVVSSFWRGWIDIVAGWVGVDYAPALLWVFGLIFNIVYLIHLSERVSALRERTNRLTQEIALLQVEQIKLRASLPKPPSAALVAFLLAILLPAWTPAVKAQAATPAPASALPDEALTRRLDWIDGKLAWAQPPAAWWWYGWLASYSALTVGAAVIFLVTDDQEMKQDMGVGGVQSLLGVAGMFLAPLEARTAVDELRALPGTSRPERERKLARAEGLLQECASTEADGRHWLNHVLGFAVNVAGGLVIWQGFHRPLTDGLLSLAQGMAINELQIWTQPVRSIGSWKEYASTLNLLASFRLLPYPGGLAMAASF